MVRKVVKEKPLSKGMDLNPIGFDWIFMAFRMVARLLKEMGVLDEMEERAKESKTEIDDKAIKIGKSVLDELAK